MSPFQIIYGKSFHLPVELEHKAYWATKKLNFDMTASKKVRFLQLNELEEFRESAYENSRIFKEKTKRWHDAHLRKKSFEKGKKVLVFNSRLRLFPGKLKSKWRGPYVVKKVLDGGALEVMDKSGGEFLVNGHRVKHYVDPSQRETLFVDTFFER